MRLGTKCVSLVFILFLAFCEETFACDCVEFDEKNADIVFVGKLISKSKWNLISNESEKGEEDPFFSPHVIKYTFDVIHMQRGPNLARIIVESGDGNTDCDALPLDVGKIYMIYAYDYTYFGSQWGISACGLVKEIVVPFVTPPNCPINEMDTP